MMKAFFVTIFILLVPPLGAVTQVENQIPEKVLVWQKLSSFPSTMRLVVRALEIGGTAGKYEIAPSANIEMVDLVEQAQKGDRVQLVSLTPTEESMSQLIPIFVPVARGLHGIRVCLISKSHRQTFEQMKNLDEMKEKGVEFVVSKGGFEESTLKALGVKTVSGDRYEDLFSLISNQTPRCFLRNLSEVGWEAIKFLKYNLSIESQFLFILDDARILHVSPSYPQLARQIETGLKALVKSGEYYKIFWKYHHSHFRSYRTKERIKIFLESQKKWEKVEEMKDVPKFWLPEYYKKEAVRG